jgi:hypothetical protein
LSIIEAGSSLGSAGTSSFAGTSTRRAIAGHGGMLSWNLSIEALTTAQANFGMLHRSGIGCKDTNYSLFDFAGIVKLRQISAIFPRVRPAPGRQINKLANVPGGENGNYLPKLTMP